MTSEYTTSLNYGEDNTDQNTEVVRSGDLKVRYCNKNFVLFEYANCALNLRLSTSFISMSECRTSFSFRSDLYGLVTPTLILTNQSRTVGPAYEKNCTLKVEEVFHLKLFEGYLIPASESNVWVWSRSTLYRSIKRIRFVYEDRVTHYEHISNRE